MKIRSTTRCFGLLGCGLILLTVACGSSEEEKTAPKPPAAKPPKQVAAASQGQSQSSQPSESAQPSSAPQSAPSEPAHPLSLVAATTISAGDGGARVFHFPDDRSLGKLKAGDPESKSPDGWDDLGDAKGKVTVPAGKAVFLTLAPGSGVDIGSLAGLKGSDIQVLQLVSAGLVDDDLATLKNMSGLKHLGLGYNQITDAGLVHLKDLSGLEVLALSFTKVTDAGMENLKGLKSLRTLTLISTMITDNGLKPLKELSSLQHLELQGTQVSDKGVEDLKKALPNCEILK